MTNVREVASTATAHTSRALAALLGIVAGIAGLGAAQLLAAFIEPESSPPLAVAAGVVDLTPGAVKQWAIDTFGSGDKLFLMVVVGVVAVAIAALAGLVSRWSRTPGAIVYVVLGVVCTSAALARPVATMLSALPSVVATVVAIVVLRALFAHRERLADSQGEEHQLTRRRFLQLSGAAAGLGVAAAATGQWIIASAQRAATIALPKPLKPLPPLPDGLEQQINGIASFRTGTDNFYRIDTALTVPSVNPDEWTLEIDGDVDKPLTLTFDDLLTYEIIERDITMLCVSNPVGGSYIGSARWLGVRVSDILDTVGIRDGVDQILSTDVDGMTISTPVQAFTDDREAMLAIAMNGEQLPREHGFPVRLVTPGLYGFVGSTKWVTKLTATTYKKDSAYWTDRGWVIDGRILPSARIDTPKGNALLPAGEATHIGGVAWAQQVGVAKVEVRIDEQEWQEATLGPDAGIDYWRQWYVDWTPSTGSHDIQVRATNADGETQTETVVSALPGAATGWHTIVVNAE
ncbi:MAG: molybdopterin-dependent oxidoreductase [Cumulibacter sp.]